ncbi:MAG: hypothetical protein JW941_07205 [Candidatus Coatesbacteria bacterium]|nr:hypothetical protein [Candidatus Coatesbacteria bacterium]
MTFLPYIWLGLSVLLAVLGFVLSYEITFWLAIDAFIVMVIAFLGVSPLVQVIVAVVLGIIFSLLSKRLAFASLRPLKESQTVRADPKELIGKKGIVVISIRGNSKRGLVDLSGEKWVAQAEGEAEFAQGTQIEISSLVGQRLVVRAAS